MNAKCSWMDFNVGRVLDRLDLLGLAESTIVAFHADHVRASYVTA